MRLGHAADLHISGDGAVDPETGGDRRRERLRRAWLWVCEDAIKRQVTHFVIAGDVFHTPHPEPADYVAFFQGVVLMLQHGIFVVIVPGNHDWELATGLSHTIVPLWVLDLPRLTIIDSPQAVLVGGQMFVGFPHPHRRAFDQRADVKGAGIADRVTAVGKALNDLIAEHGERNPGAILVAHVTVVGAKVAAERAMQLGWDVTIDEACLKKYSYAALGHIHRYQLVGSNGAYAGPIDRLSFSDEDITPGYVYVDADVPPQHPFVPGSRIGIQPIPYPHATRYITRQAGETKSEDLDVAGAYVRLVGSRGPNTALELEAFRRARAMAVVDATEVERSESTAAPGMGTGLSPTDAFAMYMDVRPPVDPVTAKDAAARMAELDE